MNEVASVRRTYRLLGGTLVLRPERGDDEAFLFELFRANNSAVLMQLDMDEAIRAQLIAFQHLSQTATYRGLFPDACYSIVERGGVPIGRFIEHDEGDVVYFVDFALMPAAQRQGLGIGLTGALMREWAARGRGARVKVLATNRASLAMCRKLGFTETGRCDDGAYVEMRAVSGDE